MGTSQLNAHELFSVTWAVANVCNCSLQNLGATKKYENRGL